MTRRQKPAARKKHAGVLMGMRSGVQKVAGSVAGSRSDADKTEAEVRKPGSKVWSVIGNVISGVLIIAAVAIFLRRFALLRRILNGLIERDIQLSGHHLRNAVNIRIRNVHRAAHVFDGSLGGHGAKGDDLRNLLSSVLTGDVLDDVCPPVHAEINVNVRHRHAFRI